MDTPYTTAQNREQARKETVISINQRIPPLHFVLLFTTPSVRT